MWMSVTTLAEPALVESICKRAVTVTVDGLGTVEGAVYKPFALILPTVAKLPPGVAFTCQLTAELAAFCTIALNCTVVPAKGCAEAGATVTVGVS